MRRANEDLDLDAVTVSQPRRACKGGGCDWSQETDTVVVYLDTGGARGRDLSVAILPERLRVSARGRDGALLEGALGGRCDPSESEWEVESGELVITLRKALQREWLVPVQPERPAAAATVTAAAAAESAPRPAQRAPSAPPPPRPIDPSAAATPGPSGLGAAYESWGRFDEHGAMAELENEGKSKDEPGWAMRSGPGAASIQCTDYVKDKEEVALDEELAEKQGALQQSLNVRMSDASALKLRGNELMASAQHADALDAYLEGEETVRVLCDSATVLLSKRLAQAAAALRRDLRNNAAQAANKAGEFEVALQCASAVLAEDAAQPKALYRRAVAYAGRAAAGDVALARTDLETLLAAQPTNAAARKLRDELAEPGEPPPFATPAAPAREHVT